MIAKQSPLEGKHTGTTATVAIRELQGLLTIDLRVAPGSPAQLAVAEVLGMDLPAKTGQMQTVSAPGDNEAFILCLAPDWWLIVGFEEAEQKLTPLNNLYHFSAVDVSGQRTTIELEGPHAREVLAHLWEQDLREKKFFCRQCFTGIDGQGAGNCLPHGAALLPCYGAKFFCSSCVESGGGCGGGVEVRRITFLHKKF